MTFALNRRRFLAGSATLLAAPAIVSRAALASSGELNFVGWAGYPELAEKILPAFTAATGIKVNFKEVPDHETMYAESKIAMETGGIDMIETTIDRWGSYNANGLLQAWDESKLDLAAYLPGLADGEAGEMSRLNGGLMIVPSVWGTEALVALESDAKLSSPASLGDLFNAENQAVLRPHSTLAAMGRYLEAQGKLPKPWREGYKDMAVMTELWDIALAEAIKAKGNVIQWWSGENEAVAGFQANGGTIGLCWDSTGFNLRNDGCKYIAPVEGAFAWNQGFSVLKNAKNAEAAAELAKFVASPQASADWATAFKANPVAKGAPELMDPEIAAYYAGTFDDAALKSLWWWPEQGAEFVAKRGEYADKYKAA
ncbi:extracellular solute-binding protein [Xinfangfangia pollutisoli]|uniref:extracellular solute-binding protein n=1 Tax=Xinfangfangia pollutisoli TaxID=2865960 RepID=UPI001CD2EBEA|nr:extracellular solute-binding protein [Xinfangfangia pollutisoli]